MVQSNLILLQLRLRAFAFSFFASFA